MGRKDEGVSMKSPQLACQGYELMRSVDAIMTLQVNFIVPVHPNDNEGNLAAVTAIEKFLSAGRIDLVRGTDRYRCFHCGVLADDNDKKCNSCGAPL